MPEHSFQMIAKTFYGLEDVLANELENLGAEHVQKLNRAVGFIGTKKTLYRANYNLRTALKILVPIETFTVRDEKELYDSIRKVKWDHYLTLKSTFAVEAVLRSPAFAHSHYVEQKVKDAVVDQFRERFGSRPSVSLKDPDLKIHVNIVDNILRLSLDSSGEALFKRGYRLGQGPAPLNEVLAAGLIQLSGWDAERSFTDFMCGSGTLPIEAALKALRISPGVLRQKYGFQGWRDYDPHLYREVVLEQEKQDKQDIRIYASDISSDTVITAVRNAQQAKLGKLIRFSVGHFADIKPCCSPGVIILNPPYGERIKQDNLNELYASIGNKLKLDFSGYEAWIFSANKEAMKYIGLRPTRKLTLYNGPLECKFHQYQLYEGTRKEKKRVV